MITHSASVLVAGLDSYSVRSIGGRRGSVFGNMVQDFRPLKLMAMDENYRERRGERRWVGSTGPGHHQAASLHNLSESAGSLANNLTSLPVANRNPDALDAWMPVGLGC